MQALRSQTPKGQRARAAILEAAESILVTHGFHGTSMRDIAKAAGLPLPSVVYHFTKKERLLMSREKEKLDAVLGGITEMRGLPSAMIIIDIKKEHIAVKEARTLGIPIFALVDTNVDPDLVDYPIPANDDALRSVQLFVHAFADAINAGRAVARARRSEEGQQPTPGTGGVRLRNVEPINISDFQDTPAPEQPAPANA